MGTIIIPIPITQSPPRREIVEAGVTYREVRPGDDATPREAGVGILIMVVAVSIWVVGIMKAIEGSSVYVEAAAVLWPFILVPTLMIIFG